MKKIPALVVAGLRSGVGKTTVTLGLIRALSGQGRKVAAFKIGPDFLDPSHYKNAGATFVRNLDPILQTPRGMRAMFAQAEFCDAIVVEGVMGLFDGPIPGNLTASTAGVAHLLGLPVLLVCDSRSCAQSIAAEIAGTCQLLKTIPLAGIVLNFVGSGRHAQLLVKGVERLAKQRVTGCIFRDSLPALPSRHLGLVPAEELGPQKELYDQYGKTISSSLPLRKLVRSVSKRIQFDGRRPTPVRRSFSEGGGDRRRNLIVAIARDEAFSFYYPETIEYFQRHCKTVVFFSPLKDDQAPAADLFYFGGGFPEVFSKRLSDNGSLRKSLESRLAQGARAYAECGGLMYLSASISTTDGQIHPMVGAIPGRCVMHSRRQALGYWKARGRSDILFLKKNMTLVGHEYHWSSFEGNGGLKPVYEAQKIGAAEKQEGGWVVQNIFASYLHLSPPGNPIFFRRLLEWGEGMVRIKR